MLTRRRGRAAVAALAAIVLATALGACSGDNSSTGDADSAPTSTGPTVEEGTTPPGTDLAFGEEAVVRYTANPKRDSLISLQVVGVTPGAIKDLKGFNLDDKTRKSGVFYVRANVVNTGTGDLGGQPITLYGRVRDELVVPPVVFGSSFQKCNYRPLTKPFGPDAKASVCMVMLAPNHGTISAVQWRPADGSAPITWGAS